MTGAQEIDLRFTSASQKAVIQLIRNAGPDVAIEATGTGRPVLHSNGRIYCQPATGRALLAIGLLAAAGTMPNAYRLAPAGPDLVFPNVAARIAGAQSCR